MIYSALYGKKRGLQTCNSVEFAKLFLAQHPTLHPTTKVEAARKRNLVSTYVDTLTRMSVMNLLLLAVMFLYGYNALKGTVQKKSC